MTKLLDVRVGLPALLAMPLLAGWHAFAATYSMAWTDDRYTHILLVVPLATALICLDWTALRDRRRPDIVGGSALLAGALVVAGVSRLIEHAAADGLLAWTMVAVVLWWIGAFVLVLGFRGAQRASFALALLVGLVPLPQAALKATVAGLQYGSAFSAQCLFELFGVPVIHNGVLLAIPGLTLQVAPQCSSIRSSSMLLVTTIAIAQIVLQSPWRKLLLVSAVVPLSVAKNGLRIFSVAMLGTRVNASFMTGPFHHQGGIIFFAIALIVIFALLWLLQRSENVPAADKVAVRATS